MHTKLAIWLMLLLVSSAELAAAEPPPGYSDAVLKGLELVHQDKLDEALVALAEAAQQEPSSPMVYYERGKVWLMKDDFTRAVDDFTRAIELDYPGYDAYGRRGTAYQELGQLQKAVDDYTIALQISAEDFEGQGIAYFGERGEAYRKLGQYGKALEDFRVLTEAVMHPMYYHLPAFIKATCPEARYRDGDEALELAKMACRASRYELPIHLATLAAAYAETADFENAVRWQERAIKLLSQEKPAEARARADYQQRLKLYQARKPYRDNPAN